MLLSSGGVLQRIDDPLEAPLRFTRARAAKNESDCHLRFRKKRACNTFTTISYYPARS